MHTKKGEQNRMYEDQMPESNSWSMPEVKLPNIPDYQVKLTDFGAVGDGRTDNSEAFRRAIQAVEEAGGGKLTIPPGLWLTGPLRLTSRLELHAEAGALVMFSKRFDRYPLVMSQFEGRPSVRCQSPLDAEGLEDVAITGSGVFDGGGDVWRPVKKWKMTALQWKALLNSGGAVDEAGECWWPSEAAMRGAGIVEQLMKEYNFDPKAYEPVREFLRPNLLSFRRCKRILLDGPTFQNSAAWNLHPWASEHVTIRNVTVRNPWYSQNGDGLDLDSCRYSLIENCTFDVGDDAICLKSGKDEAGRALGLPCEYALIRGCTVYHGHGGFVIGSEMSGGVRYIDVSDCTFIGTDIGLRFKSARGRGGVVEAIRISGIRMTDIDGAAISFNLFYENIEGSGVPREDVYPVTVETPIFRNIEIEDVICAGAKEALIVNGLAEMPLEGVRIRRFHAVARRGAICHNAERITLEQVTLHTEEGPLVKLHQCRDIEIDRLDGTGGEAMLHVTGDRSSGIECLDPLTDGKDIITGPEVQTAAASLRS
jgi:polygalacturonase